MAVNSRLAGMADPAGSGRKVTPSRRQLMALTSFMATPLEPLTLILPSV